VASESAIREQICLFGKSLYDRGLTHGSTGNISVRLDNGCLLVTPTNSSLGFLDPARLSMIDGNGRHLSGDKPTKEMALHSAFYETRGARAGAVVHLHSHHSVRLSVMDWVDPDSMLPPITPYPLMKLGRVALLPYYAPGDIQMGQAIRDLAGERSAVVFANHGPVVAAEDLSSSVYAMEELEAAAYLALDTHGANIRMLTSAQAEALLRMK
jgi:3-dehydro-4-phosphotetronate decarboxylase